MLTKDEELFSHCNDQICRHHATKYFLIVIEFIFVHEMDVWITVDILEYFSGQNENGFD
jgi:hypothetical protein